MNQDAYIFSKYLLILFSKYQNKIEGWKDFTSQFTSEISRFNSRFNAFHKKVDEALKVSELNYNGKSAAEKEISVANSLKEEINKYLDEFNELGSRFVTKYQEKVSNKEVFESDKDQLREFLAEYASFETMESANYWLESLGWQIDKYIQQCQNLIAESKTPSK